MKLFIVLPVVLLFNLLLFDPSDQEIVAYDCADRSTELTKISLLRIKPCMDPRNYSESSVKTIQLVQKRQYVSLKVYSCLVTVRQMIQHCGMHSHVSSVAGGFGRYVHYIGQDECLKAHRFRHLNLNGIGAGVASQLTLNGTTEISANLQGYIGTDGSCQGVAFSVGDVHYKNVIVQAAITISLYDYSATANTESNTIVLRSGISCNYNAGYCFDDVAGEVTWQFHLASLCNQQGVDVLYEGNATLLVMDKEGGRYVVVETSDTVFALRLTRREDLCHQHAWQTEQNRLLVIFEDALGFFYLRTAKLPQNTDLMAHVLSKLLYLEIAVKRQMADVIFDSILKRCQLREKILQNRISLALQSPDAVGNLVKESTGYVSRVMGEVLYIAKCKAVVVDYRRTSKCYQELPVVYRNESMFRTAMTHIITKHGTEVDCQPLLPVSFALENNWVELNPEMKRAEPAIELDANEEVDQIVMRKISPISSNGVYTKEDMEKFQNTLLFPTEKEAISNQVVRRIAGKVHSADPYDMQNLFTPNEFRSLAHSAAEEVWGFLSHMGNLFSICGFVYTVFCLVSYGAGVVLNYFTLDAATKDHPKRRRYLWSSLWQTLTHRTLYKLHKDQTNQFSDRGLEEVVLDPPILKMYPELPSAPEPCFDPACTTTNKSA